MFLEKLICTYSRCLSKLVYPAYQWFLPTICILCSFPTKGMYNICYDCQQDLPILPQCCPQCAKFLRLSLELTIADSSTHGLVCGSCLHSSPPFNHTYALFPYKPPIIQLIIQLKFYGKLNYAKAFGELFIQKIADTWYQNKRLPDVIIPIPLHPNRLRERGFNQVVEMAKPISNALGIPLDFTGIIRIKETQAQSGLPKAQRISNIANAFLVKKDYSGLQVAVMDDVITTGQTITEFCRLIKAKGAKSIHVWCCARRG